MDDGNSREPDTDVEALEKDKIKTRASYAEAGIKAMLLTLNGRAAFWMILDHMGFMKSIGDNGASLYNEAVYLYEYAESLDKENTLRMIKENKS